MKARIPLLITGALLSAGAMADWGSPLKWDQFDSVDSRTGQSWSASNGDFYLCADDFLCTSPGYINEIRVAGHNDGFNLGVWVYFWSDVPAGPNDESHPGTLLSLIKLGNANSGDPNKIGWFDAGDGTFRIDLPQNQWFHQDGTAANPTRYWVGVQARHDIFGFEKFYQSFRTPDRHWGDDAVFSRNGATWSHWGEDPTGNINTYDGILPTNWRSVDMAFQVYGTPEPSSFAVLGLGLLALLRRKRK